MESGWMWYLWLGDGRGGLSNSWSFSLASGITSSSSVSMPRIINWAGVLVWARRCFCSYFFLWLISICVNLWDMLVSIASTSHFSLSHSSMICFNSSFWSVCVCLESVGSNHRWELPGNYRDSIVVMVFYLFCRITKRIIVTAITGIKIYLLINSLIILYRKIIWLERFEFTMAHL